MKQKKLPGYSLKEVDAIMKKYIEKSAERLRANLRLAWKRNEKLQKQQYVER